MLSSMTWAFCVLRWIRASRNVDLNFARGRITAVWAALNIEWGWRLTVIITGTAWRPWTTKKISEGISFFRNMGISAIANKIHKIQFMSKESHLHVWLHFCNRALMLFKDWLDGGLFRSGSGRGWGVFWAGCLFWGLWFSGLLLQGLLGWLPQSAIDLPEISISTLVFPQFPFFWHASWALWIWPTTFWTICLTIWFIWFSPNCEESILQAESNPPLNIRLLKDCWKKNKIIFWKTFSGKYLGG